MENMIGKLKQNQEIFILSTMKMYHKLLCVFICESENCTVAS